MITNVDIDSNEDRFKPVSGIGLYKINYEMDLKSSSERPSYIAGIIAYTNDEAVQTLVKFCQSSIKGFKGLKIQEIAFEGLCHEMSEEVKNALLSTAVREGKVVATESHKAKLEEVEAKLAKQMRTKKSIVPKKE